MPIEFRCPNCQSLIRTPDGSAGKQARCPKCSETVVIPAESSAGPTSMPSSSGFQPPPSEPSPPWSPAQPTGKPNPFGDSPSGELNPYASPAAGAAQFSPGFKQPLTVDQSRMRLLGPAIGMGVSALVSLGYAVLTIVVVAADPNILNNAPPPNQAAERIGYFIGAYGFMATMCISPLIIGAGVAAMLMVRSRWLAMTGAIAALLPCSPCCFLGFPFAIWGLFVLNQDDVKRTFQ